MKKMISNITSALHKTTCMDYVDFGKNADQFDSSFWSQIEQDKEKYLDIQFEVFLKDDKEVFCRHQQIKLEVFDFKQVPCLRSQIILAIREFSTHETFKEVVISHLSKDLDEQLKRVPEAIKIFDRPRRNTIATMKKYCMDEPESTYVQLRLFTRNSEHDKFQ